jgi:hypothetical protein
MLVDSHLVLARSLVNGVTITQDWTPARIDYIQIELDGHDCVIAEGAWSETYADAEGLRGQFHNAAEFYALHPGHQAPAQPVLCAPRPEGGPGLDAVLRGVVARAAAHLTPGPLQGSIDRVTADGAIDGWAHDVQHPEMPVLLEVVLDGLVVATALACDYRDDLRKAGKGQGRCAFFLTIEAPLRADLLDSLRVRRAGDGAEIQMSLPCRAAVMALCGITEEPGLLLVA